MKKYRIAYIPGDGIGKETGPEGVRVLEAAARKFGFELKFDEYDWSCDYYAKHGRMMPEDGLEQVRQHDAIFFGAAGWPATVPDHVSLWGLLIPFRRNFEQYVNLRPVRLMPGVKCPLADRKVGDIDFWVVRENSEGEYSSVGGRMGKAIFSRRGTDRIMKFAFELARKGTKKHVTSATKSNGISISMPYWDERFKAMAAQYPDIKTDQYHIDILTAHFVMHPDWFDVVVGSNLFGDILSDLGPACTGTIGIAPSANMNLSARYLREENREPRRPNLVGRDDARAPGPPRRRESDRRRHRSDSRRGPAHARCRGQVGHRGDGQGDRRRDLVSRLRRL